MQRFFLLITFCVMAATHIFSQTPSPSVQNEPRGKQQTVYLFGVSQVLTDSVVYISDITPVSGYDLVQKDLLSQRSEYAEQFRAFVEQLTGKSDLTTAVFFALTRESAERKLVKFRKSLQAQRNALQPLVTQTIDRSNFAFRTIKQQDAPPTQP